ncbi:hypothetical protein [Streptomyces sp. 3N207]|uniref:hypothetical protein n=1 Tax=Streptomyces sp. 3N207 TaxID=3457417 RepID=UPI003FD4131E
MIAVYQVALATPATMDADAYREFCWGADLDRTDTGYGLLLAVNYHKGDSVTAVLDDPAYARLLAEASGSITVPAHKVIRTLREWADLRPAAATVWP